MSSNNIYTMCFEILDFINFLQKPYKALDAKISEIIETALKSWERYIVS